MYCRKKVLHTIVPRPLYFSIVLPKYIFTLVSILFQEDLVILMIPFAVSLYYVYRLAN
ncbi:hypothetical protein V8C37DRAFT_383349 [Trichoderma ceciliae]